MQAGFAKVDITPISGLELAGFGPFLQRRAEGVHIPLYARAAALADWPKPPIVILAVDLLGLEAQIVAEIKQRVCEERDLPAERILVHCTHTHSSPATVRLIGWGQVDLDYVRALSSYLAEAASCACENLEEVEVGWLRRPIAGLSYNRVGRSGPAEDPGTVPRHAEALAFVHRSVVRGVLVHWSCQPIVLSEHCRLYSGDWPGAAMLRIEESIPGSVSLFLQGSCGEVLPVYNHEPADLAVAHAEELGLSLAAEVLGGLESVEALAEERLSVSLRTVAFPHRVYTEEEVSAWRRAGLLRVGELPASRREGYKRFYQEAGAQALHNIRLFAQGQLAESYRGPLHRLAVGPLVMVAHPFDMYYSLAQRVLRQHHGPDRLWLVGFSNDSAGHAAPREQMRPKSQDKSAMYAHYIGGRLPYAADMPDRLVEELLASARDTP